MGILIVHGFMSEFHHIHISSDLWEYSGVDLSSYIQCIHHPLIYSPPCVSIVTTIETLPPMLTIAILCSRLNLFITKLHLFQLKQSDSTYQ